MTDLKEIIAQNITELRRKKNMTQAELAQILNYSDKAVSKWERAKSISDVFEVNVDYLLCETHPDSFVEKAKMSARKLKNRGFITGISVFLVWFVATLVYIIGTGIAGGIYKWWLIFVYSVPVSFIVWLVLNSIWFNKRVNFVIISLLIWSGIASIYVTLLTFGINMYLIFILALIGQAIVLLWSRIRKSDKKVK